MSNYYKINQYDTANGEGLRVTIFFSGCTLKCKGCFNKELWDFNVGKVFSKEVYENARHRITTAALNKVINTAFEKRPPTPYRGQVIKVYFQKKM